MRSRDLDGNAVLSGAGERYTAAMTSRAAISWGELLWDLFDDGPRLGGCAANVAYHLAVLEQPSALITRVGNDELGERAVRVLSSVGVDTSLVQVDTEQPTGSVAVDTSGPDPKYTIAQRVAWDRIELNTEAEAALRKASAIVFGTLAQRTPLAHTTLTRGLSLLPEDCLRICDLNLRRPHSLEAVIRTSARSAHVVKLNSEEAAVIAEMFGVSSVAHWLLSECGVRIVIETRGAHGSFTTTGTESFATEAFPVASGGDPVGAGDAFCARLTQGLLANEPLRSLMREANRYAARVASLRGATPEPHLLKAT